MGQAFRRASGKVRATSATSKTVVDRRPPATSAGIDDVSKADGTLRRNAENVLEEKDPQFDAMLSQMVGRVRANPGGRQEIDKAVVAEKYKRPLPKLRNTKPDSNRYDETPTEAGTLNVVQIRQIVLLHEGKSDDHNGPMDIHQIAEKFRVDVAVVQRFLQFVSLPPEDNKKEKGNV